LWHLERHKNDLPAAISKNIVFRAALLGYLARTANLAYPSVTMGLVNLLIDNTMKLVKSHSQKARPQAGRCAFCRRQP
jgi:hypothetical protein